MRKILVAAVIFVLGAMLGVGCYLAYQQFHTKGSDPIKTSVTVKEQEDKHRLDMELAVTDAEKEFFAMMNNYFDAIDKAVEYKREGQKTDFNEINFLEIKIAFYLLFNEDKIRKELMREQLLPLMNYYTPIMEKYGINNGLKDNALIKKPKKKLSGLISEPHQSVMKSTYFKNGGFHDSIVICTTYIYATKRVIKK